MGAAIATAETATPEINEIDGGLVIDQRRRLVTVGGRQVGLTPVEWNLLNVLASDPERVWPRRVLLDAVWGCADFETRRLDAHACRLRRKLGNGFVVNVWGVGYRLIDPVTIAKREVER